MGSCTKWDRRDNEERRKSLALEPPVRPFPLAVAIFFSSMDRKDRLEGTVYTGIHAYLARESEQRRTTAGPKELPFQFVCAAQLSPRKLDAWLFFLFHKPLDILPAWRGGIVFFVTTPSQRDTPHFRPLSLQARTAGICQTIPPLLNLPLKILPLHQIRNLIIVIIVLFLALFTSLPAATTSFLLLQ